MTNEFESASDWAWGEGIAAIDAKDEEYKEASVHAEMFIVLGNVLRMNGWAHEELVELLNDCVFENNKQEMLH